MNNTKASVMHFMKNTLDPAAHKLNFEPIPVGEVGDPPGNWKADGVEVREWRWVLEKCPKGMIRSTDRRLLVAWCETCAIYDEAQRGVAEHGMVLTTPNGQLQSSPYVTQLDKALQRLRRLAEQLGFSPSARTRISTGEPANKSGSTWEKLKDKTAVSPMGEPNSGPEVKAA